MFVFHDIFFFLKIDFVFVNLSSIQLSQIRSNLDYLAARKPIELVFLVKSGLSSYATKPLQMKVIPWLPLKFIK